MTPLTINAHTPRYNCTLSRFGSSAYLVRLPRVSCNRRNILSVCIECIQIHGARAPPRDRPARSAASRSDRSLRDLWQRPDQCMQRCPTLLELILNLRCRTTTKSALGWHLGSCCGEGYDETSFECQSASRLTTPASPRRWLCPPLI